MAHQSDDNSTLVISAYSKATLCSIVFTSFQHQASPSPLEKGPRRQKIVKIMFPLCLKFSTAIMWIQHAWAGYCSQCQWEATKAMSSPQLKILLSNLREYEILTDYKRACERYIDRSQKSLLVSSSADWALCSLWVQLLGLGPLVPAPGQKKLSTREDSWNLNRWTKWSGWQMCIWCAVGCFSKGTL